jgi:hypothetical protein
MTNFNRFGKLALSYAGAVVGLLALVSLAPADVQAGCSHLVTSRTDLRRDVSLIETLIRDLANDVAEPSEPRSAPPLPRSCSGALCSGQPAAPATPAGAVDGRLASWAWWAPIRGLNFAGSSFLAADPSTSYTVAHGSAVFHPPRVVLSPV